MTRFVYFAGLYGGSAVVLKASGFLLSLWIARILQVSEYGQWGLLFSVQTGLATFGLVGIFEAVVALQRHCKEGEERATLFAAANKVFVTTAGAAAVVAIGVLVYTRTESADVLTFLAVLASGVLLAFATLQSQLIRLEERHAASLVFSFWVPVIALVGSAIAFLAYSTSGSFFWGSAVGLLGAISILWRMRAFSLPDATEIDTYRHQILAKLGPYIAIAFFGWMSGYGNNFIIAKLFNHAEIARFTFAMSIAAIMQLVASALNQVWSPRFFQLVHVESFEAVEKKNRKFFFLQSLALGSIAMLGLIVLPFLLKVAGGSLSYYSSMENEFFALFSGYIVLSPWWHCQNYFLAHDLGSRVMNVVIATSAVGVSIWIALMWIFGPVGIYLGFFVQMLLRSIGISLAARVLWKLRIDWFGPLFGISLAGAGLLIAKI